MTDAPEFATPWRIEDCRVVTAGGQVVAINSRGGTDREWIDRGDIPLRTIVKAVNAHDALVELARHIATDGASITPELIEAAVAALKLAEGKQ